MSPEHIGPNMERIRTGLSMTRTYLAERLGVSRQFLTTLEEGVKWPSVERLCDICEELGCDPRDLLTEEGSK